MIDDYLINDKKDGLVINLFGDFNGAHFIDYYDHENSFYVDPYLMNIMMKVIDKFVKQLRKKL